MVHHTQKTFPLDSKCLVKSSLNVRTPPPRVFFSTYFEVGVKQIQNYDTVWSGLLTGPQVGPTVCVLASSVCLRVCSKEGFGAGKDELDLDDADADDNDDDDVDVDVDVNVDVDVCVPSLTVNVY